MGVREASCLEVGPRQRVHRVDVAPLRGGLFGQRDGLGDVAATLSEKTRQRLRLRLFRRPPFAFETFGFEVRSSPTCSA